MSPITATDFITRSANGDRLNVLDVREYLEYRTYNIGGQNIPLSKLSASLNQLHYNKTDELIVICTKGLRSETATRMLTHNGYQNARNLAGGLIALQKINNKKD